MFYKPGSLPEPGGPDLAFLDPPPGGVHSSPFLPLLLQGMEDLLDGRLHCGSDALSGASQVGGWIVAVLPLLVPFIHLPEPVPMRCRFLMVLLCSFISLIVSSTLRDTLSRRCQDSLFVMGAVLAPMLGDATTAGCSAAP